MSVEQRSVERIAREFDIAWRNSLQARLDSVYGMHK